MPTKVPYRKAKQLIIIMLAALTFASFNFSTVAAFPADVGERSHIIALVYHHIVSDNVSGAPQNSAVIELSEFEAQMDFLHKNGYYTASLEDVKDFLYGKKELPERTVLITFDDGYESNYTYAFPVLKKYGFKAVIFLIGKDVVGKGRWNVPHLSEDQIKEMMESGLIEFGSHTFDAHYYLKDRPAAIVMSENELQRDFEKIKSAFKEKGLMEPYAISYPYGKYDEEMLKVVKKFYKMGFTIKKGVIYQDSDPYKLSRNIVMPGMGIENFKKLLSHQDYDANGIFLKIDSRNARIKGRNVTLPASPIVKNKRALIPVRLAAEALGLDVNWDFKKRLLIVSRGRTSAMLKLDSPKVVLSSGKLVDLEVEPIVKDGLLFGPVRLFAELGFQVRWDSKLNTIEIF
ncbi:MAG: hypothetical protein PWP45_1150 [Tepidanaerobacteraceae bacterium]|nr:hypothetical protein [Tepidanaerobacteraceae bacterium]